MPICPNNIINPKTIKAYTIEINNSIKKTNKPFIKITNIFNKFIIISHTYPVKILKILVNHLTFLLIHSLSQA
jgi:hypothetical protein